MEVQVSTTDLTNLDLLRRAVHLMENYSRLTNCAYITIIAFKFWNIMLNEDEKRSRNVRNVQVKHKEEL